MRRRVGRRRRDGAADAEVRGILTEPGVPDHHVERLECLLLAGRESGDPLYEEFKVGLGRTEIDVLGMPSRCDGVVIVWRAIVVLDDG